MAFNGHENVIIKEKMSYPYHTTPDGYVKVYTDGVVGKSKCGKHTGIGIGIYFSEVNEHSYYSWESLNCGEAQMEAAEDAIHIARGAGYKAVEINTDSQYVVDMTLQLKIGFMTLMPDGSRVAVRVNKISKEENAKANDLAHSGIGSTKIYENKWD